MPDYLDSLDGQSEAREAYMARLADDMIGEAAEWPDLDVVVFD